MRKKLLLSGISTGEIRYLISKQNFWNLLEGREFNSYNKQNFYYIWAVWTYQIWKKNWCGKID
jgi:hypothetical protein